MTKLEKTIEKYFYGESIDSASLLELRDATGNLLHLLSRTGRRYKVYQNYLVLMHDNLDEYCKNRSLSAFKEASCYDFDGELNEFLSCLSLGKKRSRAPAFLDALSTHLRCIEELANEMGDVFILLKNDANNLRELLHS